MNDPYHVYMDLDVVNNEYSATSKPQLRFEETRNTPFLPGDSADYFCSIIRFNIQTGNTLPVFIPKVQTGQTNVNKTIYKVTLMMADQESGVPKFYYGSADVFYEPEDLTAPLPASPMTAQDLSTNYYYVYNYQHWIYLVNLAIINAWNVLRVNWKANTTRTDADWVAKVGGEINASVGRTLIPPYIDFQTDTNRVVLSAPNKQFNENVSSFPNFGLVFNDRLYELFAGLPSRYAVINGTSGYLLRFVDRYTNGYTQKIPKPGSTLGETISIDMLYLNQEVTSIAVWNPVASIVFASSLLPIIPTQTSVPKDVGSSNLLSGGNNSNLLPILSDFAIAVDSTNQYRPMVEYTPQAEYRLIEMNSTTNLSRIDIIVYWKDRAGGLHPFQLQPGCAASVKIMFRRKDFNVFTG